MEVYDAKRHPQESFLEYKTRQSAQTILKRNRLKDKFIPSDHVFNRKARRQFITGKKKETI